MMLSGNGHLDNFKYDEVVKSRKRLMIVIPAPYQVRGKLQPESRVPDENRDPWVPPPHHPLPPKGGEVFGRYFRESKRYILRLSRVSI
jgi:hypothetical protein